MKPAPFTRKALICSLAALAMPASAVNVSWDGNGNGSSWNDPVNWLGNAMPLSADTVSLGNLAAAENDWVNLNINDTIAGLAITDGMTLDTNGYTLLVNGDTTISGQNGPINNVIYPSSLSIDRGAGSDDFDTNNLTLTNDGELRLRNGGILEVDNVLTNGVGSGVRGEGIIRLVQGSGTVFVNDGILDPTTGGMTINASGTGMIDLDGTFGNGRVSASASKIDGSAFDNITINAHGLTDAYDGEMAIAANGYVDMNLANAWTLGSNGLIRMHGNSNHPGEAQVNGSDLTIYGTVNVNGGPAHGRFNASVNAQPGSTFDIGVDDQLTFAGATNIIEGANFNLDDGAHVEVFNNTTVDSFTLNAVNPNDIIEFNGNTSYSYSTAINSNAVVQQTGNATVIGGMVVNGGTFDMDGRYGTTTINLGNNANNGSMTLNVDKIDNIGSAFNGTINTAQAGLTGGLTVNLPGNNAWTMAGTLNLVGNGALFNPTRIAGSKMIVAGEVNIVNNSPVRIAADVDFANGSNFNTQGNTSRLTVAGSTHVAAGANFNGTGTLRNTGSLQLAHGVNTQDVRLINNGTLIVGNSPGSAIVHEFEQAGSGDWQVEIGGTNPGTQHDRLNVAGTATLGGNIDLSLINAYDPAMLEEVTVLSSFNRVDIFDTVGGIEYQPGKALAVTYTPTDVLVTATLMGDFDLDGDVDDSDIGTAFSNYSGPIFAGMSWADGDADGDGDVDDSDIGSAFANYTGPLNPVSVPEPTSLALLALGGMLATRRRRA